MVVVMEPLPPCEPGGTDPAAAIDAWFASPAMRELLRHFTGREESDPDRVAELSSVWDFRGGTRERFDTARVGFGADDEWIRQLIHALGNGGRPEPAHERYDHVVILGGGIRVTLGRVDFTARLIAGGLRAGTVAGLGSLRHRDDREHREGIRLGLGALETEADMMTAALRRFLHLPAPAGVAGGDGWWHKAWPGTGVHVLAAASKRSPLRASTGCTLLGWAERIHQPAPTDRVLLVTNDPYVRHQHCDAVRLLGLRYGCGIETVGMDEHTTAEWGRPLATTELLQEVRSSVLAMRNLYAAAKK
jgi:hypothetical protein